MSVFKAVSAPMLLGECPTWCGRSQALYWTDIPGKALHRLHPASGKAESWAMPTECGSFALTGDGRAVLALRTGLYMFDFESATFSLIQPAPYDTATTRFNDGRADAQGRFWVGSMYEPRGKNLAELYVLEKNKLRSVFGGIMVSNGLGFSPDGKIIYHTDSATQTISKYAFDSARGVLGTSHFFFKPQQADASQADYLGRPDGAAVDSQGCYWVAMITGGCVLRLSPEGKILTKLEVPCQAPTMPCFGGADLKTLYVTTASQHPSVDLTKHPDSGCVFAIQTEVAGLPEPYYLPT